MYTRTSLLFLLIALLLISCTASRHDYIPTKKYPRKALQEDFQLLRNILEKKHPSLYWYNSEDSVAASFDHFYSLISDSMTEQAFAWKILAPLTGQFHCGHTTVSMSKAYGRWAKGKQLPSFPIHLKVWNDTMAVTGNLNRKDSIFKRGTLITSINGIKNHDLIEKMFTYLPTDGHALNINYVRLSSNFPYYHRNIFGLSKEYRITYLDSSGIEKTTSLPLFAVTKDTTKKTVQIKTVGPKLKLPRLSRKERLKQYRELYIDSAGQYAILSVHTFSGGNLRTFFRRSFKKLRKENIPSLIIDVRSNGGGHVALSTLLTKYVTRSRFRVADSVYAVSKSLGPYTKHIKGKILNNLEMLVISRKRKDGLYHVPYLEKKYFRPKKNNYYNGNVYVLTAGSTFSAASLLCNTLKGQEGITLVGEETGGGWHGNNGIMIPEIKLPHTKLRVRLPLYRLVQFNHIPKTGTGVLPDVHVGPDYRALINRKDKKMEVVKELIRNKQVSQK